MWLKILCHRYSEIDFRVNTKEKYSLYNVTDIQISGTMNGIFPSYFCFWCQ